MNWLRQLLRRILGVTEILQLLENIMSKITDYTANVAAFMARVEASTVGLTADITQLKALIEQLQTSPGPITAEDQAALDASQALIDTATVKLEALDALTVPTPPLV